MSNYIPYLFINVIMYVDVITSKRGRFLYRNPTLQEILCRLINTMTKNTWMNYTIITSHQKVMLDAVVDSIYCLFCNQQSVQAF